jgi:putative glutamine amidotransferase
MARPLIGITMDYSDKPDQYMLTHAYATAVEKAGGMPFPLAYLLDHALIPEVLDRLEGIVFTGGQDIDPVRYGEARHPQAVPLHADRERFEFALLKEVESRRMPTLGICLGSQVMNVYRGGSLFQFLPDLPREGALEHRRLELASRRHPIQLNPETELARRIGKTQLSANTSHKQAMKTVGRGLRVIATAPDGVIEGVEDPSLPLFLALQWHPERLHEEPEHLAPFQMLVERAGAWTWPGRPGRE